MSNVLCIKTHRLCLGKQICKRLMCSNQHCYFVTFKAGEIHNGMVVYLVALGAAEASLWCSRFHSYFLCLKTHCEEWWSCFPLVRLCWDSSLQTPKAYCSEYMQIKHTLSIAAHLFIRKQMERDVRIQAAHHLHWQPIKLTHTHMLF